MIHFVYGFPARTDGSTYPSWGQIALSSCTLLFHGEVRLTCPQTPVLIDRESRSSKPHTAKIKKRLGDSVSETFWILYTIWETTGDHTSFVSLVLQSSFDWACSYCKTLLHHHCLFDISWQVNGAQPFLLWLLKHRVWQFLRIGENRSYRNRPKKYIHICPKSASNKDLFV